MTRSIDASAGSGSSLGLISTSGGTSAAEPGASAHAAPPSTGSPESVIAAALLALEDAEQRQELLRLEASRGRIAELLAAVRDRRRENRLTLTAGVLGGVADIAQGAGALVSSARGSSGGDAPTGEAPRSGVLFYAKCALGGLQGLSSISSTYSKFEATDAGLDADVHDMRAEALEEASKRAGRARDDADGSAERMLEGMREVARIRHEAALAVLRG